MRFPQPLGGVERRRHDRHVAGAAAQMPAEIVAQLRLVGVGMVAQIKVERHQDAGGAKAALQRVVAAEGFLQDRQPARLRRQPFDGADTGAVGLHRQRQAGARRNPVDLDRAGAADTVLAADMGAGHRQLLAQEVGQQHARLGLGLDGAAVELEADAVARVGAQARHRRASSIVARPSWRTRLRR